MFQSNQNAKVKFFLNFIIEKYNNPDYIELMRTLDDNDVIEGALEYKKTIKSRIAAQNYLTSVNGFLKQNRVKNAIFEDREKYENLKMNYEKIVLSDLPERVHGMDIYSDEELIEIDEKLSFFISEDRADNIIQVINTSGLQAVRDYGDFVSGLILKLILIGGFRNDILANIQVSDYNTVNHTLNINNNEYPLPLSFSNALYKYIEIRKAVQLESKYGNTFSEFFLKKNGRPMKNNRGNADNATMLITLEKIKGKTALDPINKRKIIQMMQLNIDQYTIEELTGYKENVIKLCYDYYKEEIGNAVEEAISKILAEQENPSLEVDVTNTGKFQCPVCMRWHSNNINNWIAVIYENSEEKLIVCKKCKGVI